MQADKGEYRYVFAELKKVTEFIRHELDDEGGRYRSHTVRGKEGTIECDAMGGITSYGTSIRIGRGKSYGGDLRWYIERVGLIPERVRDCCDVSNYSRFGLYSQLKYIETNEPHLETICDYFILSSGSNECRQISYYKVCDKRWGVYYNRYG